MVLNMDYLVDLKNTLLSLEEQYQKMDDHPHNVTYHKILICYQQLTVIRLHARRLMFPISEAELNLFSKLQSALNQLSKGENILPNSLPYTYARSKIKNFLDRFQLEEIAHTN